MKNVSVAGGLVAAVLLFGGACLPAAEEAARQSVPAVFSVVPAQAAGAVSETGIPAGMEETYRLGMDPSLSEVPVMYSIHPCPHCVHLRDFLDRNGVKYEVVYVDDFSSPAREELVSRLESYNSRASYPTLVTPDGRSVVGFREKAVKRLLGLN